MKKEKTMKSGLYKEIFQGILMLSAVVISLLLLFGAFFYFLTFWTWVLLYKDILIFGDIR